MAIAASTVFECNASATAGNINGGGFNPANANGPTDGVIAGGTGSTPTLTSATYTFVSGDVGAWVYFKTQTNMVNCYAQIASVSGGVATLSAAIGQLNLPTLPVWTTNTVAGVATTAAPTSVTYLVDYSRSTASRQSWANLSGTTTTLSDASSGGFFTPVMVGNLICLSAGTSLTKGWYEITAYTNANTVTIDRTSGTSTGVTGNVGGAVALDGITASITATNFLSLVAATASFGSFYFFKSGTYTIGAAVTATSNGNSSGYSTVLEGYSSVRGDSPTGSSRPIINTGSSFYFQPGQYNLVKNIQFKGSNNASNGILYLNGFLTTVYNCLILNTYTGTGGFAIACGSYGMAIVNCDICCYNGTAISFSAGSVPGFCAAYNYIHDSINGLANSGNTVLDVIVGNLFCAIAGVCYAQSGGSLDVVISNTTVGFPTPIANSIGISQSTNGARGVLMNNIAWGQAKGLSSSNSNNVNVSDYNDLFNNTTNYTSWTAGAHDVTANPSFTSVAGVVKSGTCTTTGTTLTDSTQNFTTAGVVAGRDCIYVSTNTGGSTGTFGITAVGTTTITTDNSLGTGSATVYQIVTGRNFLPTGGV